MTQAGFERTPRSSARLTLQLFERISAYHSVPRLRHQLLKINFSQFQSQVPPNLEKDLVYLISGLTNLLGFDLDPINYPYLAKEVGEYLRLCDNYGLSIHHFLLHTAKYWNEIRPKFQELSRTHLSEDLQRCFPNLNQEKRDCFAAYLLHNGLARSIPVFRFNQEGMGSAVSVARAQPDLPWNLISEALDFYSTMRTHFPEFDWQKKCEPRGIWFLGVRILSQLSSKTVTVIRAALENLNHCNTSLLRHRKKLVYFVFFNESDPNLFKFNLHHHARLAGMFYEIFEATLADFRQGYPEFSGLAEKDVGQSARI